MPPLKNARREKFAQELAKGKTQAEAIANAGYDSDRRNSTRLKTNEDVQARLAELQQRAAAKAEVTAASLIQEAEEARSGAMADKQYSAAIAAVREKGVLAGVRIERSEHGEPGEFEGLEDPEFAQRMNERLETAMAVVEQGNSTEH